jgi:hypothetical protein
MVFPAPPGRMSGSAGFGGIAAASEEYLGE